MHFQGDNEVQIWEGKIKLANITIMLSQLLSETDHHYPYLEEEWDVEKWSHMLKVTQKTRNHLGILVL